MVDKRESYTKEDLLASGRGELFGAKGPQLPAPNMLMMDRVIKMTETGGNYDKGYVEAELDINPDLWFFGCHFIGDPVMGLREAEHPIKLRFVDIYQVQL